MEIPARRSHRFADLAPWLLLVLGLLSSLWLRARFCSRWELNFDADEALVAMQARDFLHGHCALFLPGQSYMGSLQSLMAAPLLAISAHPNVVRLVPVVWVALGLLALVLLERAAGGRLSRGRGLRWLAFCWILPPAVLFLAGMKARGGNLEALVLGFFALALLWLRPSAHSDRPESGAPARSAGRPALACFAAGALLGVAAWTHDQAFAFLPLALLLLLLHPGRRLLCGLASAAGLGFGYLPLWLPRLVPFGLGPPGMEGAGVGLEAGKVFTLASLRQVVPVILAAVTTRPGRGGHVSPLAVVYAVVVTALVVIAIRSALREHTGDRSVLTRLLRRPALVVTLWLALLNFLLLFASPDYLRDPQWFRYTLGIACFLAVGAATALAALPLPVALAGGVLLGALSTGATLQAREGWAGPPRPKALAQRLIDMQATHVQTDWDYAFTVGFLSGGQVLCSSPTPPRLPAVNASVDFAPRVWTIRRTGSSGQEARTEDVDRLYRIEAHPGAPPEVSAAFARLDLESTLFAHFEPFPLLEDYERDWRGWPYRRPLSRFDSIVWEADRAAGMRAPLERVEEALGRLQETGEFIVAARWQERSILVRARSSSGRADPQPE